jgi:diguanylate cyclase (GGDEF)-like protein
VHSTGVNILERAMAKYVGSGKLMKQSEALIFAVVGVGSTFISLYFDTFGMVAKFAVRYPKLHIEVLTSMIFCVCVAALVIAFRRAADLAREIVKREDAEQLANSLARHDPLTGLPNRRRMGDELNSAIEAVGSSANECAVFVIDLDQFKPVNDLHGHKVGDAVLVEVANRLKAAGDERTTFARLGGDEFVAISTYPAGADDPARAAGQFIRVLGEPFLVGETRVDIGATIGIARCPQDGTSADKLLRAADVAMYEAKRAGRGRYHFFDAEMDARLRERTIIESDLRAALESGEVEAYFQPVMSLADSTITGFEALARWNHPTRGLLAPELFIPIAEDLGLIDKLSYGILRSGCIAARDWPPHTTLAINIAPMQLKDPWLSARLLAILTEHGLSPSRLIVEVTENAIIEDIPLVANVFSSLQNAGIRIALDDFGKGYSSLNHLRQLRFDHLKIDSSFVLSMDASESRKIVSAIAGLGKALGMPVTAEGVETEASADTLRSLGCEQAQGYLFGRPVSAGETAKLFYAPGTMLQLKKG